VTRTRHQPYPSAILTSGRQRFERRTTGSELRAGSSAHAGSATAAAVPRAAPGRTGSPKTPPRPKAADQLHKRRSDIASYAQGRGGPGFAREAAAQVRAAPGRKPSGLCPEGGGPGSHIVRAGCAGTMTRSKAARQGRRPHARGGDLSRGSAVKGEVTRLAGT